MGYIDLNIAIRHCKVQIKNLSFIIEERKCFGFSKQGVRKEVEIKKLYTDILKLCESLSKLKGKKCVRT